MPSIRDGTRERELLARRFTKTAFAPEAPISRLIS
jgi:hypothetical protein